MKRPADVGHWAHREAPDADTNPSRKEGTEQEYVLRLPPELTQTVKTLVAVR